MLNRKGHGPDWDRAPFRQQAYSFIQCHASPNYKQQSEPFKHESHGPSWVTARTRLSTIDRPEHLCYAGYDGRRGRCLPLLLYIQTAARVRTLRSTVITRIGARRARLVDITCH